MVQCTVKLARTKMPLNNETWEPLATLPWHRNGCCMMQPKVRVRFFCRAEKCRVVVAVVIGPDLGDGIYIYRLRCMRRSALSAYSSSCAMRFLVIHNTHHVWCC